MVLAMRIMGAAYIFVLGLLGGFFLGAPRRPSSPSKSNLPKSNILPFRNVSPRSAGAQVRDR